MDRAWKFARRARLLGLLGAAVLCAGCVERVLVVDSRPRGARFALDGVDRGTTPQRIPYLHDGRFRVRLELEGYESIADEIVTCTGTDAIPGIDFFAENVYPGKIRRVTTRHYDLVPLTTASYTEAELEAMVRHADAFRERAAREVAEPGSPQPTRPSASAPVRPSARPAPPPPPPSPSTPPPSPPSPPPPAIPPPPPPSPPPPPPPAPPSVPAPTTR